MKKILLLILISVFVSATGIKAQFPKLSIKNAKEKINETK